MNIKRWTAAGLMVATASLGLGGVAVAQTTRPSKPATNGQEKVNRCAVAVARLPVLQARLTVIATREDFLNQAIAWAQARDRDDLVQKLQGRLADVKANHDKVTALIARIHERCDNAASS